jgi:hypothetical protein
VPIISVPSPGSTASEPMNAFAALPCGAGSLVGFGGRGGLGQLVAAAAGGQQREEDDRRPRAHGAQG